MQTPQRKIQTWNCLVVRLWWQNHNVITMWIRNLFPPPPPHPSYLLPLILTLLLGVVTGFPQITPHAKLSCITVINAGSSPSCVMQAPWSTGTECVAKYNFQTANEQDLPFCKGDVLTIIGVTRVRKPVAEHTVVDSRLLSLSNGLLFKEWVTK